MGKNFLGRGGNGRPVAASCVAPRKTRFPRLLCSMLCVTIRVRDPGRGHSLGSTAPAEAAKLWNSSTMNAPDVSGRLVGLRRAFRFSSDTFISTPPHSLVVSKHECSGLSAGTFGAPCFTAR